MARFDARLDARLDARPDARHVAILGAGVVGAMSALQALQAGLRVTLVDPGPPGGSQSASYGNAGWLSSHSILPPATPGLWKQLPRLLTDPLGPLTLRWRYLPRATPWLIRYLASGWTPERIATTARALRSLLADAPALHEAVAREAGLQHLVRRQGLLHVFTSRESFEAESLGWRIRKDNGIGWMELGAEELHRREPHLHERYNFGAYVPEAGHCTDPGAYVAGLVAHARQRGAEFVQDKAIGFRIEGQRLKAVRLASSGDIACDSAVIAAGAHSRALAAEAGDRVPLDTERGYHAWLMASPQAGPRTPMSVADRKVVATSMAGGLRVAGQVEIAGLAAQPDWRRAELLRTHLESIFPGLADETRAKDVRHWLGHRPSIADGLPCIGPASRCPGIVHAFGHGHVGLVGSARTGRLVAQLLTGTPPEISLEPFSPRRFS